jgi:hypothetical protein
VSLNNVTVNEAQTRAWQIDPQLRAGDWRLTDRTQVRLEVPVDGYDAEPWNGVTDYCLYEASGNVLAVVEAKRCSRNAREADEQLRYYVTEIAKKQPFAPFGFMANGHDIWFWEIGLANPHLVAGFFTPADLERLKFLRQNRRPLEATSINSAIVDRSYQHEAIRRLASAATFGSGSRQSQNASRDLRAENGALCWRARFCDLVLDCRRACRYTVAIRSKGAAIIEFQEESMGTAGSLSTFRRGSAHARLAFPPLVPEACAGAEARTQEAARRGESNRRRT